ncbi:MAG: nucleotidyl transferase AbiEii/AbiGii toxin family protein [Solirubrobacteraceae bacterium]|nr:nucleotidyl transferase AbiEii/AbiGii toxin family protein [Solirubrobacteraceae bacterium]
MVELQADELLRRLAERRIDFVVIGGIAMILQGSGRNTFDLDLCFATDANNLRLLGEALVELGASLRGVDDDVPFVPDARTLARVDVLTLHTRLGNLDVLRRPAGAPTYERLRTGADVYDIGGIEVRVASVDDLLAMKRAAGREKDLVDVSELEMIKRLRRRPTS